MSNNNNENPNLNQFNEKLVHSNSLDTNIRQFVINPLLIGASLAFGMSMGKKILSSINFCLIFSNPFFKGYSAFDYLTSFFKKEDKNN